MIASGHPVHTITTGREVNSGVTDQTADPRGGRGKRLALCGWNQQMRIRACEALASVGKRAAEHAVPGFWAQLALSFRWQMTPVSKERFLNLEPTAC